MNHTLPTTEAELSSERSGVLDVLRNRNFLFLWLAQALSQTAQNILNYVLLQQAFALSKSSIAVSMIMICFALPAIVLGSVAGVFVDRKSKRNVLTVTNVLRGLSMLAYIFFTGPNLGGVALVVLYAASLFFSAVSQFFNPAESAAIPLLVTRSQLVAANSLFNLTLTASQFVGFLILGPLLVKLFAASNDFGVIYLIMAGLFAVCTLLTWLLPGGEKVRSASDMDLNGDGVISMRERALSTVRDLKEGWRYIRGDREIFAAIIYWSVAIAVLLTLGVVGPGFLEFEVGINPHDLYIVLLPGGLGLVAGVMVVGRVATRRNRLRVINLSMLAAGIALIALASLGTIERWVATLLEPGAPAKAIGADVSPYLIGSMMAVAFALGFLNSLISVPAQTTLQDHSHEAIRARVFGAFYTVQNIIVLVPLIVVGALADSIGVVLTIAIMGAAVIGVAVWGLSRRASGSGPQPAQTVESAPQD